jgi:Alkylmercury lyase
MEPPATSDATIRLAVFESFVREGAPPTVEELMGQLHLSRREVDASLDRLDEARHLKLVPGTHRILMAFPFSAVVTPYRVTVKGRRSYFANCAWDAIAFYPMLKQPMRIESFCYHCGEPFDIQIPGKRLPKDTSSPPVVYLGLPAADWWNDIISTCANTMLFFRTADHLASWRASVPDSRGAQLSVDLVLKLSEPLYAGKMKLDYARPSRDQMALLFHDLHLTGDFWKI